MVSTCRYYVASTGIPPVSRRRVRRLSQGRGSGDPRRRRFVPLGASEATFTLSCSVKTEYHETRTCVRISDIIIAGRGACRPLPYSPKSMTIRAAVSRGSGWPMMIVGSGDRQKYRFIEGFIDGYGRKR